MGGGAGRNLTGMFLPHQRLPTPTPPLTWPFVHTVIGLWSAYILVKAGWAVGETAARLSFGHLVSTPPSPFLGPPRLGAN